MPRLQDAPNQTIRLSVDDLIPIDEPVRPGTPAAETMIVLGIPSLSASARVRSAGETVAAFLVWLGAALYRFARLLVRAAFAAGIGARVVAFAIRDAGSVAGSVVSRAGLAAGLAIGRASRLAGPAVWRGMCVVGRALASASLGSGRLLCTAVAGFGRAVWPPRRRGPQTFRLASPLDARGPTTTKRFLLEHVQQKLDAYSAGSLPAPEQILFAEVGGHVAIVVEKPKTRRGEPTEHGWPATVQR